MSALLKPIVQSPIIAQCVGCAHVAGDGEVKHCDVYKDPEWKWALGQCNFNTHVKREKKDEKFINPLKLAKMRARGLHH